MERRGQAAEIDGQAAGQAEIWRRSPSGPSAWKPSMRAPILALMLLFASAAAPARDYRLCVDSNDWASYTHPDRDGSLQILVRKAMARQGDSVRFIPLPWLRCEAMAERGAVDGLVGVPGIAAMQGRFAFPLAHGVIDIGRAPLAVDIVLVRDAASPVQWDGHRLTGLKNKVAYVQGYDEIGERLDQLGIPHSDDYHSDEQDVKALMLGRINVFATYAESAALLLENPDYRNKLVVLDPPLCRVYYFVAFSKRLYAADSGRIETLWRTIADLRERG
jgi:hypothetical protein